jgi:uncharacterized RDD family membrane protein YckC
MKSFRDFREAHNANDGLVLQTLPIAARAMQGERAGFFTRSIAAVIDVVIVGAIMIGVWIAVWLFLLVFNPLVEYSMPRPGYFVLGGYFLMWAYWTWGWATSGRSIGQGLMGVRVLNRRDRLPSWKVAALRSALCVTFQIGIVWILVSRKNRSIQDVLLRTSVIHDWSSAAVSDLVEPLGAVSEEVTDAKLPDPSVRMRVSDHVKVDSHGNGAGSRSSPQHDPS